MNRTNPHRSGMFATFLVSAVATLGLAAAGSLAQEARWEGSLLSRGQSPVPPGFTSLVRNNQAAGELQDARDVVITGLPLSGELAIDAIMSRIDVYAPDAKIMVAGDAGEHSIPAPTVANFRGEAAGHDGSSVFLSVSPWWIYGYAEVDGRTYIISTGPAISPQPPVVFDPEFISEDDLNIVIPPCQTDTTDMLKQAAMAHREGSGSDTRAAPCRVAKIAFDSDYELTQVFGGDPVKSTAYIATVGAAMNDIYSRDVNTHIVISYSRVWTTANDPWTKTGAGEQLDEFRAYWVGNMLGTSRNLAHFLSARGLGGGVAWVSVVCNYQYGYAVSGNLSGSFPYPLQDLRTTNWDPFVVAHEMGHNFGTLHTHDYTPPIDTCGLGDCVGYLNNGTIMSYCHTCWGGMKNIKLKFGDVVSARILQYLTDEAACELGDLPKFTKQPASTTVALGGTAKFTTGTSGPGLLSYQWLHDNVEKPGATSPQLTIAGVTAADAGQYVLRISNVCNTVFSNPAFLTVQCPSDFDQSGFVDTDDFDAFVVAFTAGLISADFDKSGFVDFDDFNAYVVAFESGC